MALWGQLSKLLKPDVRGTCPLGPSEVKPSRSQCVSAGSSLVTVLSAHGDELEECKFERLCCHIWVSGACRRMKPQGGRHS